MSRGLFFSEHLFPYGHLQVRPLRSGQGGPNAWQSAGHAQSFGSSSWTSGKYHPVPAAVGAMRLAVPGYDCLR